MSQGMRHFALIASVMVFAGTLVGRPDGHLQATTAQPIGQNHDPDAAKLITSDIPNFWRVLTTRR